MSYPIIELSESKEPLAEAARSFCLSMIQHYYDIRYRPDWHADLDSLVGAAEQNWFSPAARGSFWVIHNRTVIVAALGIYNLEKKTVTRTRLSARYPNGANVCQVVRAYVSPEHQGSGMGKALLIHAEDAARDFGYQSAYLHADSAADKTLSFWERRGYTAFGRDASGVYVDFDKPLNM